MSAPTTVTELESKSEGTETPALQGRRPTHSQPFRKRSLLFVFVLGVGLVSLAPFAFNTIRGTAENDASETSARTGMPVAVVRVGTVSAPALSRSYSGVLMARRESQLSFERGGLLVRVEKHEGDRVKSGELMALLDQGNLDAAEARTKSELLAAEALLAELVAGPRRQTLDAAAARVERLAAEVALAQVDARRQNRLLDSNATSRADYDSSVFGLEAKEKALMAEKATLAELVEGTRKEQIAGQRAQCASIRAALQEIEAQRRDSRIEAPYDGKIQSRLLDEGAVVAASTPVFALVSHAIEARFGVPAGLAASLPPNSKVIVRLRDQEREGSRRSTRASDRLADSNERHLHPIAR